MMNSKKSAKVFSLATMIVGCFSGQASGEVKQYTPEQVMVTLRNAIADKLGFGVSGQNGSFWLGLSTVGSVVEPDDPSQVNDLANFCPDASPVIQSYNRVRKLDRIYEKVMDGLVGPVREFSDDYNKSKKFLGGTVGPDKVSAEYDSYLSFENRFQTAFSSFLKEKDRSEKAKFQNEMNKTEDLWLVNGFRAQVDQALSVMKSENFRFGSSRDIQRRRTLENFRREGLIPLDVQAGFVSPMSSLSPPPANWEKATGWVGFEFSESDTETHYSATNSSTSGFGGLNLGFVTAFGTSGGGNGSQNRVAKASKFSYTFEIMRVTIRRPWFDGEVFFEPKSWTWKKVANTSEYPNVAVEDKAGLPQAPMSETYDNSQIGCSLLPVELVIARKRSLTATMSKDDYKELTTSGSSGGGGGAFGIFGGKKKKWSTTTIDESGSDVTFKMDAQGTAVIGIISEIIPELPKPNMQDTWPSSAWLKTQ